MARRPNDLESLAREELEMAQSNWRWCRKCRGLFLGDFPGSCPAGAQHDMTGSGNYRMQTELADPGQHNWRRCQRCSGLFYWHWSTTGWCPAGGGHDYSGSLDYSLLLGVFPAPYQSGWYWCPRCAGLFFLGTWFGASTTSGWCPAGGGHQRVGGDAAYSVYQIDF
jgi:hypothetical protein